MANYYLSNKAEDDILEIYQYSLENWSEEQAEIYYQLIYDKFEIIIQNPKVGNLSFYLFSDVRKVAVKSHYIFYRVLSNDDVEILRILHQKMDFESQFND